MGTWGVGLYQDDLAEEIRDYYKEQLKRGKREEEITRELVEEYESLLSDTDDAPVFWFALADTQWNLGRLEDTVKRNALYYIQNCSDRKRWKSENPEKAKKREQVLEKLKEKLMTPQPEKKKISIYKLYRCEWKLGDVYAYSLDSECAKEKGLDHRYFLFHKVGEATYYPGHVIPIVRVKITKDQELPKNAAEFDKLEYVQTAVDKNEEGVSLLRGTCFLNGNAVCEYVTDEFGFLPIYRLELINTSKKAIPEKLLYVGNFKGIHAPQLEFVPEDISLPVFLWKFFDPIMIDRYCGYNLRQYEIYKK